MTWSIENGPRHLTFQQQSSALSGPILLSKFSFQMLIASVFLTAASAADETACFEAVRTEQSSTTTLGMGSILLNKCTGQAWLLMVRKLDDGTSAMRWMAIKVGDGEAIISPVIANPKRN